MKLVCSYISALHFHGYLQGTVEISSRVNVITDDNADSSSREILHLMPDVPFATRLPNGK